VVAAYSSMGRGRITQMSYLLQLSLRASENSVKRKSNFRDCGFSALGRSFFDGAAPAKTRAHLSDAQCQRIRLKATCCTLQQLVARQCRGGGFGLESTAAILLTKTLTRTSWASLFYGFCRKKRRADERTRTAFLLITSELFNRRRYTPAPPLLPLSSSYFYSPVAALCEHGAESKDGRTSILERTSSVNAPTS
jgi:hypothetical protein